MRVLQSGNIAPVDLPQSTIGPGIKVFSRYAKVVEADGSAMSVGDALAIINDVLGEILDGEEAELDSYTRFALTWYAEHGWNPGPAGAAMSLAQAKNTSLAGAEAAGVGEARGGEFRLFERYELDTDWTPAGDDTLTVWEATPVSGGCAPPFRERSGRSVEEPRGIWGAGSDVGVHSVSEGDRSGLG